MTAAQCSIAPRAMALQPRSSNPFVSGMRAFTAAPRHAPQPFSQKSNFKGHPNIATVCFLSLYHHFYLPTHTTEIHRCNLIFSHIIFSLQAAASDYYDDPTNDMSIVELKAVLQDTFYGTERGLSADSDTRAEVVELISQLEARNPTPAPTEALELLNGTWKLAYTSNSELVALLALGKLPLVTVGDVYQIIDGSAQSVENRIQLSVPGSRTSLTASASFEVRSPKLLQIEFREGQVGTPELLADFELPSNVELLGQNLDLTPIKSVLQPLDGPLKSAVNQLGQLLAGIPDLKFPIDSPAPSAAWLLTTYLDKDLRISRGDGGSVFVLVKEEVDPLLLPASDVGILAVDPDVIVMEEGDGDGTTVVGASYGGNGTAY